MTIAPINPSTQWTDNISLRSLLVTALCLACVRLVMTRLAIVDTRSIDPHCLWRTGQPGRLGEYAEFPLPDSAQCPALSVRVSKRLACGPGDHLARDDHQFFCNGQRLGHPEPGTAPGAVPVRCPAGVCL